MKLISFSVMINFLGAFAMGLVHNPRTLILGVIAIPISLGMMFYSGYRKGSSA